MGEAVINCHGVSLTPCQAEESDAHHKIFIEKIEDKCSHFESKTRICPHCHKIIGTQDTFGVIQTRNGIFLLVFSSLFVWDITVSGNETIPESVILDAMEENGLRLGAFIPSLDTERIEGVVILEVDGISFISVNLRGTVANVELRERADNTEIVDIESPSNLVASRDGQISALEITGGVSKVKLGEIVKKGDLLASGVIDSAALGYRLVRARGSI